MKIRMKVGIAGPSFDADGNPHYWPAVGEVAEVDDAEAVHLLATGQAEAVKDEPVVEHAVAAPETVVEKAVVESPVAKKSAPMTTKSVKE